MAHLTSLIGSSLVDRNGPVDVSTLEGKVLGLYFSAHWCPPCRGFTPFLAEAYTRMKAAGKPFEIVFISSDRDPAQFREYLAEMPWAAVAFGPESEAKRAELGQRFKVAGIPSLVIVDADGETITTKGREAIQGDPAGARFPWHPPSFRDVIAGTLLAGGRDTVDAAAALEGKYVGVYFSAHWCPPCRAFTPSLTNTYNELRARGNNDFEVVFVSSDKSVGEFNGYFGDQPWLAVPFSDDARKAALSQLFDVEGLPTLVIVGPDGKVHNANGRAYLAADPHGQAFPWTPRLVNDLAAVSDGLNTSPSLIVFGEEEDDGDQEEIAAALDAVARAHKAANPSSPLLFFTSFSPNNISPQIRKLTGARTMATRMIILDIPDRGAFYEAASGDDVTEQTVQDFVQGYTARTLTRRSLQSGR